MKKGIHPQWYEDAIIECACGNKVVVGSTKRHMKIEVCSACHPFYTGQAKYVADTRGRVRKFLERYGLTEEE